MPCSKALWKYKLFFFFFLKSLLPCLSSQVRDSSFPAACIVESSLFAKPLATLCPWVLGCGRQWQLTGTNSFAPGVPGMQTQKGSITLKRNHQTSKKRRSPRGERNSRYFALKSLLVPSSTELARSVCKMCCWRPCCSPYSSSAGECHAAVSSLAPRFTWKHSKLLSFWQCSNCSTTLNCFTLHCFPCQEALLYYSMVV